MPRVIFFGTPEFAVPSLVALKEANFDITVITTPDKPTGRDQAVTPSPVKVKALELGLQVLQPASLSDDAFFQKFIELRPDVCVVVAYGKIIPEFYIDAVEHGFVNVHPSLLPKYRGPSPIQGAIMSGDDQTGVSIMLLDKEVDHGPVLAQSVYRIPRLGHYSEIVHDLAQLGAELLSQILPLWLDKQLDPVQQDHNLATFTKLLTREDGKINWADPAEKIFNQIRALNPNPGTWALWQGSPLRIIRAHPLAITPLSDLAGVVVQIGSDITVQTGTQPLRLEMVQPAGSRIMTISEFVNGQKDFIGSTLE